MPEKTKKISKKEEITTETVEKQPINPAELYADLKPGMVVKIHQKIKETNPKGEEKERIQVYSGTIIARQHGKGVNATITVRKVTDGIGVEKIFPLHLPTIAKIETTKRYFVRQAKLYYLRNYKKKLKEDKNFTAK